MQKEREKGKKKTEREEESRKRKGTNAYGRACAQRSKEKRHGKARQRQQQQRRSSCLVDNATTGEDYGNPRCEGMCCSLEAVGGRVAARIVNLPDKRKPPWRGQDAWPTGFSRDACAYAWNPAVCTPSTVHPLSFYFFLSASLFFFFLSSFFFHTTRATVYICVYTRVYSNSSTFLQRNVPNQILRFVQSQRSLELCWSYLPSLFFGDGITHTLGSLAACAVALTTISFP